MSTYFIGRYYSYSFDRKKCTYILADGFPKKKMFVDFVDSMCIRTLVGNFLYSQIYK